MAETIVDGEHEFDIDVEMRLLGLCGSSEPTGRRCFRQAGHAGRCTFLSVSTRGPRIRPDAVIDLTRPHPAG